MCVRARCYRLHPIKPPIQWLQWALNTYFLKGLMNENDCLNQQAYYVNTREHSVITWGGGGGTLTYRHSKL
jgi:hypothetical protein